MQFSVKQIKDPSMLQSTMGSPVQVYIYDLSQGMASQLGPQLIGRPIEGIWHTAVVVHGQVPGLVLVVVVVVLLVLAWCWRGAGGGVGAGDGG